MLQGFLKTIVIRGAMVVLVLLFSWTVPTSAQPPSGQAAYSPLSARMPPGVVGSWSAQAGRSGSPRQMYFQPVEVRLVETGPSGGGRVTWFAMGRGRSGSVSEAAPHAAGLMVGATYRVGISDMPEFPGVTVYPTIEVIDRLHPPLGRRYEFPIPVELTGEDIRLALQGKLVTRVVFLEEPRLAAGNEQTRPMMVRDLDPRANALSEADRVGRPMIILRLGSRTAPIEGSPESVNFFNMGRQPIELTRPAISKAVSRIGTRSQRGALRISGTASGTVRIRSTGRPMLQVAGGAR